ncbi:MAG TPA: acetate--CoA ligase family protein [Acidimicrobiales bacterium]|jgi:acyl-CoA synthetase (NDP forming)|nr:acetate--CoA ligase family protein [Acidimicrobiales bacterium]
MTDRPSLQRLLQPSSVAVVGATDSSTLSQTVASIFENPAIDAYVVNPKHPTVFGQKTFPSLTAIGRPVDTVFSLMSAAGTAALAEEAADLGVGGMVVMASGFAEVGGDGEELQNRLRAAAARGNFPVVGPNGVGYIDVTRHCEVTFLPRFERRAGGLSVVAHSGALLEAVAASSFRPGGAGLSMLISAGNEAVTDMADYLDFLVDHEPTKVIALALEKIRRPEAFFAAAARARRAGKPVIALKLGRTSKGRVMTQSHTGTVTGDSWVYDVAFRQAGIATAKDVDELVDRVQFLEQLPTEKWTALHGLGVLTGTGGFATMTADLAQEESIDVPDPDDLRAWVQGLIPSLATSNPLDATGVILSNLDIWQQIVTTYAAHDELDALIFLSQFAAWDTRNRRFSDCLAEMSKQSPKPFLLSPLAGQAGQWMEEYRTDYGIALGNGLRGTIRGLQTMAGFKRGRADAAIQRPESVPTLARPAGLLIESDGEWMLPFGAAMDLLASAGIAAAPFALVRGDEDAALPSFEGPYVVKLADVAHRTEHGAVLTGVTAADVAGATETLRKIAARDGLPDTVVLQPQLAGHGEAFIGLTGDTELGPMVAFGLGGVFVEVMKRVGGRLAPFAPADAEELVAEFDDLGVIDGVRGRAPWDRAALFSTLCNAGRLVAGGRSWIRSMDLNPLIVTEQGLVAVDCVCFVDPAGA